MKYVFLNVSVFLATIALIAHGLMTTIPGLQSLLEGCIVVSFACFGLFMLLDTKEMVSK